MTNCKYLKVMFGNISGADKSLEYKINELNIATNWNPAALTPKDMGGFNYSNEENILRWLIRGDTLYDVVVPEDAEVIKVENPSTPNGVFRTNKIIFTNPRRVNDEIALELYEKSKMPDKTYYKALAGLAIRGYRETCIKLIKDRISKDNIDEVLCEFNEFVNPDNSSGTATNGNEVYNEVLDWLNEIKSDLLISRFVDKGVYNKVLTNDKVINITGESGSGKSYFTNKYINDDSYIVIDTDIVFGDKESDNKESMELRELFKGRPKDFLITNFDYCYSEILNYFKDSSKTIVIDSAQYRNIDDFSILKGEIIVMRTSIDKCYERCIDRWKKRRSNNYCENDLQKFKCRKLGMYKWYKRLNLFIDNIDKL